MSEKNGGSNRRWPLKYESHPERSEEKLGQRTGLHPGVRNLHSWVWGDFSNITGNVACISGDVSGLNGEVSHELYGFVGARSFMVVGCVTGLTGDIHEHIDPATDPYDAAEHLTSQVDLGPDVGD